jgi:hypothetical protein
LKCHFARILYAALFTYRALRRFGKGFVVGYGLRVAFGAVPVVLASLKNPSPSVLLSKLGHVLVAGTPIRFGLFLGSCVMTFESLMRLSRSKSKAHPHLRSLLCGLLAGPSLLWLEAADREAFALFLGIRALETLCNYGTDAGLLPTVPHADTLLMMASSVPTLWAWLLYPNLHDLSYKKFLDFQGGRSLPKVAVFGLVNRLVDPAEIAAHPELAKLNVERAGLGYAPIDGMAFPALTHRAFMHPDGIALSYWRFLLVLLLIPITPLLLLLSLTDFTILIDLISLIVLMTLGGHA